MKNYRFREEDIQGLIRLINMANRCSVDNDTLKPILTEMVRTFQARDALYFSFDPESRSIDLKNSFCLNNDNSYLRHYLDHYKQYDPLYSFEFHSQPFRLVFKTDDIIPYSQLIKLEYYHDFLRPQGIYSELIIRLCSDNKLYGVIELLRSQNLPAYDDIDLYKAMILAACLTNAFRNADLLTKINEERKLLEYWADCQQMGIILVDYKFKPIYCNRLARELCVPIQNGVQSSKYDVKTYADDFPIPPEIIQGCMELKKEFESKDYSNSHQFQCVWYTENGRIYMKYYLVQPSCSSSAPFFVINLQNLTCTKPTDFPIGNNDALTKREHDIVQNISQGLTNREIADRLSISKSTVNTHIRNIFAKTGLKNRVQILNLLKPFLVSEIQRLV